MKKQIAIAATCIAAVVLVAGYTASLILAQPQCRVPSINSKLCADVESITSCEAQNGGNCVGSAMYVINSIPDGTDPADEGTTMEIQAECYTKTPCKQNDKNPYLCEAAPAEQPVNKKKIVENPNVNCPNP